MQTIKKAVTIILVLLFLIILSNQAEINSAPNAKVSAKNNISTRTHYSPSDVGMSATTLGKIDSIVKDGIKNRVFPGCQIMVMKEGKPIYDKCFGNYTYESAQKVTPTTLYDLASLSKTTGTLLAVMKLYDNNKLQITDKASKYITFLRSTNKESITIKELLFHESGLPAGLPFYKLAIEKNNTPTFIIGIKDETHLVKLNSTTMKYKWDWVSKIQTAEFQTQVSDSFYLSNRFHKAAMQMIADTHLNSKAYVYSCINFILLKEIVETISGISMDEFLNQEFYTPMKLSTMTYLPLQTRNKEEITPTLKKDFLRNGEVRGYVHDPDAAFLGGVSGNAGLFASAADVAIVHQMLLNKGELDGERYLSAITCDFFTTTVSPSGRRGLGYDKPVPAPKSSPCCTSAPSTVYGHTGYTGTCCWVDPTNNLIYVFLSNRTYPNDGINKLAKTGIRTKIQEVVYQSMK